MATVNPTRQLQGLNPNPAQRIRWSLLVLVVEYRSSVYPRSVLRNTRRSKRLTDGWRSVQTRRGQHSLTLRTIGVKPSDQRGVIL